MPADPGTNLGRLANDHTTAKTAGIGGVDDPSAWQSLAEQTVRAVRQLAPEGEALRRGASGGYSWEAPSICALPPRPCVSGKQPRRAHHEQSALLPFRASRLLPGARLRLAWAPR
jgi:hypothetical protein